MLINSVPSDKFLNLSKLKAFGNDKINVTGKLKFVCSRVEIIVGKGENAGNHYVFKAFFFRVVKSRDCVVKCYTIMWDFKNVRRKTVCSHFPLRAFSSFKRISTFCNFTGTAE